MDNRKTVFLGDEAVAQAALDAGISGVYAYPGTPSTEIMEFVQHSPEAAARCIHRQWSANEKTAMEEALGMSYAGKRALVCMKHVGLNVAADAFINAAVTGVHGGLVVVAADDPSMHSSQNEQDSRFYGKFASVPVCEPSCQQESYDMIRSAFEFSEQIRLPVLLRFTTRLAHSRGDVATAPARAENPLNASSNAKQWVLLPAHARRNWANLLARMPEITRQADAFPWNRFIPGSNRRVGIIAAGIAFNYLNECYPDGDCPYPILKVGQYPLSPDRIGSLQAACDSILVLEDGAPFIEEQLVGLFPKPAMHIRGRLDGTLPRTGELTPENVASALGRSRPEGPAVPALVVARPPALCRGCPHCDTYAFLNEVMAERPAGRVFADIGCYTLGALPPYESIHTCVDMGASITMAKGAADAGLRPAIAVIGDSTFTHSGITGLLDAVAENSPVKLLILDNEITGMTGGQESLALNRLEGICAGIGVDPAHIRVLLPLAKHHAENAQILREEIAWPGVSVLIARRACIQIKRKG
ncbi:MAG: indolepyruvate ferredoxin oxidoreductase subunit alpha [Kiritimatiellia bacterium]